MLISYMLYFVNLNTVDEEESVLNSSKNQNKDEYFLFDEDKSINFIMSFWYKYIKFVPSLQLNQLNSIRIEIKNVKD